MPNRTTIARTDLSSNPLRYRDASGRDVWACVKVSSGCTNCYSAELARRYSRGTDFNAGEMAKLTPYLDEREMHRLATSKALTGKRVFIADMTDLFGEWVPTALIDELFAVFAWREDVTFQILTKRPLRMQRYLSDPENLDPILCNAYLSDRLPERMPPWPLPNVWAGTSVEDQTTADERIPLLLRTPAAVRFLSCEPLLGPVSIFRGYQWARGVLSEACEPPLQWVIAGGEGGPHARPANPDWFRSLRDQCQTNGIPYFHKQNGGLRPGGDALLDGVAYHEFPRPLVEATR